MTPAATLLDLVTAARTRLRSAGIQSAELDARLLAQHALGWSDEQFFTADRGAAPPEFASRYAKLVARRAGREPLAYIVGYREFWGLPFGVSPAVLIPRPETELLVEVALDVLKNRPGAVSLADVCTGSGCVAVSVAHEWPNARIIATDISRPALDVARANAVRHGVADRVRLVRTDLLEGVNGAFDVITANPPYVASRSRGGLQPEVRDHEPDVALYGGEDGLTLLSRLFREATPRLKPEGVLVVEFGYGQDEQIEHLIATTPGLTFVDLRRDLQGIARTAVARRTS